MVPSIEDLKEMKVKLIPLLCELNVHLSVAWMLNVLQLRYEMIGSVEGANNYPPLNELEFEIRDQKLIPMQIFRSVLKFLDP